MECRSRFPKLNDDAIGTRKPARRLECGDRKRLDQWRAIAPERAELLFRARTIEVHQVMEVAGREVREPLVEVEDADLVQHLQAVAARGALVAFNRSELGLRQVRLDLPPDLAIGSAEVPLDRVSKQMSENEDRLLRAQIVVDPDLGAIQIAGKRMRNVRDDDWQLVPLFKVFLDDVEDLAEPI